VVMVIRKIKIKIAKEKKIKVGKVPENKRRIGKPEVEKVENERQKKLGAEA
jgi:hypothetical protein